MATGTAEHIDATTAAEFLPVMYAKAALVAREQKLVFAMGVNRQFENDAKWGDTINVRARSHLTAQTKDRDANAATIYETIKGSRTFWN